MCLGVVGGLVGFGCVGRVFTTVGWLLEVLCYDCLFVLCVWL